ncbi:MAG: hypothetical protein A2148_01185 [Chloroflexi bacterium RBG_16_68_14]|nr:MAG: hypothetical protein A2148_01185 [Chloroflexi bacterium RBG_16_68_14]
MEMNTPTPLGLCLKAAAAVVLALGVGLLGAAQTSAQGEAVGIGGRTTAAVGTEVTLDLEALNIEPPGLGAWEIDVFFDPAVVTAEACDSHPSGFCNLGVSANRARTVGATASGFLGDTTLASITFRCVDEGATSLAIAVHELADATPGDLQPIDAEVEHGAITCVVPAPPPPPVTPGDVNCDGRVTSRDAQLVLQLEARLIRSLPCQENADVNGDGEINSVDAALILQFVAGLLDSLG